MRKLKNVYYFSVEGQTEKWYLEWLEKQINSREDLPYLAVINCKVEKNPLNYVKSESFIDNKQEVWHLCDYESAESVHSKNFFDTMDLMKKAMHEKSLKYEFGYSNFTFDLWMILHKIICNSHLTDRSQYIRHINRAFKSTFCDMDEYKHENNFKSLLATCTLSDVVDAIERSKAIMKMNVSAGYVLKKYKGFEYYDENPSLMIWQAIEKVLKECGYLKGAKRRRR